MLNIANYIVHINNNIMNINKLNEILNSSKLNKIQIAEKCNISRTTLDNVLSGADAKISTIESLAKVLDVQVGILFDNSPVPYSKSLVEEYKEEIDRLKSLLDKRKTSTKVVVELEVDSDEFVKMGLKDKVIQILNRK